MAAMLETSPTSLTSSSNTNLPDSSALSMVTSCIEKSWTGCVMCIGDTSVTGAAVTGMATPDDIRTRKASEKELRVFAVSSSIGRCSGERRTERAGQEEGNNAKIPLFWREVK
eukprot:289660-Rhodomonas_salina.3